jgi:hypothetical protein
MDGKEAQATFETASTAERLTQLLIQTIVTGQRTKWRYLNLDTKNGGESNE